MLNHAEMGDIEVLGARGLKPSALALAYGVSARRVYQILQEEPATEHEVAAAMEGARELAQRRDPGAQLLEEIFGGDDAPEFELNAR